MKRLFLMTCAVTACFVTFSAQGQVKSSVFDDVKVWYKGSAGNAVGTADRSGVLELKVSQDVLVGVAHAVSEPDRRLSIRGRHV